MAAVGINISLIKFPSSWISSVSGRVTKYLTGRAGVEASTCHPKTQEQYCSLLWKSGESERPGRRRDCLCTNTKSSTALKYKTKPGQYQAITEKKDVVVILFFVVVVDSSTRLGQC